MLETHIIRILFKFPGSGSGSAFPELPAAAKPLLRRSFSASYRGRSCATPAGEGPATGAMGPGERMSCRT